MQKYSMVFVVGDEWVGEGVVVVLYHTHSALMRFSFFSWISLLTFKCFFNCHFPTTYVKNPPTQWMTLPAFLSRDI